MPRSTRILLALAVAAIVLACVVWWVRPTEAPDATAPGAVLELASPPAPAGGSVRLTWKPVAGAEGYRIEVCDDRLELLVGFGPVRTPGFTLQGGVALALPAGDRALVRIVALRKGEVISESEPRPLVLP